MSRVPCTCRMPVPCDSKRPSYGRSPAVAAAAPHDAASVAGADARRSLGVVVVDAAGRGARPLLVASGGVGHCQHHHRHHRRRPQVA